MGRDALDSAWRPHPPRRRRDDKPPEVQASKPSTFAKVKAGVQLAGVIHKIRRNPPSMKSWRTTIFGTGGVGAIAYTVIAALADGDPATNPDWSLVIPAALAALGLLFARDNVVTSEKAGAKK